MSGASQAKEPHWTERFQGMDFEGVSALSRMAGKGLTPIQWKAEVDKCLKASQERARLIDEFVEDGAPKTSVVEDVVDVEVKDIVAPGGGDVEAQEIAPEPRGVGIPETPGRELLPEVVGEARIAPDESEKPGEESMPEVVGVAQNIAPDDSGDEVSEASWDESTRALDIGIEAIDDCIADDLVLYERQWEERMHSNQLTTPGVVVEAQTIAPDDSGTSHTQPTAFPLRWDTYHGSWMWDHPRLANKLTIPRPGPWDSHHGCWRWDEPWLVKVRMRDSRLRLHESSYALDRINWLNLEKFVIRRRKGQVHHKTAQFELRECGSLANIAESPLPPDIYPTELGSIVLSGRTSATDYGCGSQWLLFQESEYRTDCVKWGEDPVSEYLPLFPNHRFGNIRGHYAEIIDYSLGWEAALAAATRTRLLARREIYWRNRQDHDTPNGRPIPDKNWVFAHYRLHAPAPDGSDSSQWCDYCNLGMLFPPATGLPPELFESEWGYHLGHDVLGYSDVAGCYRCEKAAEWRRPKTKVVASPGVFLDYGRLAHGIPALLKPNSHFDLHTEHLHNVWFQIGYHRIDPFVEWMRQFRRTPTVTIDPTILESCKSGPRKSPDWVCRPYIPKSHPGVSFSAEPIGWAVAVVMWIAIIANNQLGFLGHWLAIPLGIWFLWRTADAIEFASWNNRFSGCPIPVKRLLSGNLRMRDYDPAMDGDICEYAKRKNITIIYKRYDRLYPFRNAIRFHRWQWVPPLPRPWSTTSSTVVVNGE